MGAGVCAGSVSIGLRAWGWGFINGGGAKGAGPSELHYHWAVGGATVEGRLYWLEGHGGGGAL